MNSPSICIHTGNDWNFNNCVFKYFIDTKSRQIKTAFIDGYPKPIHSGEDIDRWIANSKWVENVIKGFNPDLIGLEGYSYGSKGSLPFSIAENTMALKLKLRDLFPNTALNIFSPMKIKKFASGKGNANKLKMFESFLEQTGFDITKAIPGKPDGNPISDIVDSYFIAKLTFYENQKA